MAKSQIFINYRRDDTQESTVFLSQLLAMRYPGQVFFDRDTIQPGRKYLTDIHTSLQECGVVIAVIGERWLTLQNAAGEPRLHDPQDILRLELKVAIERGIPIIPLLVGNSRMPTSKDLPEDIRALAEFQATRIYFDDVSTGLDRLCKAIDNRLAEHRRPAPIPSPSTLAIQETPSLVTASAAVPSPPATQVNSDSKAVETPRTDATQPVFPATPPSSVEIASPADLSPVTTLPPPDETAPALPALSLPSHHPPPRSEPHRTFIPFLRAHRRVFILAAIAFFIVYFASAIGSLLQSRSSDQRLVYVRTHSSNFVVPGTHDASWALGLFGASTDYSNGLQWAREDFSELSKSTPVNSLADAWHAVETYNRIAYGSYTDWRLPTSMELNSLCGTRGSRSFHYLLLWDSYHVSYWTSDVPMTAIVNCKDGNVLRIPEESSYLGDTSDPSSILTVRPVRGSLR